MSPRSRTNTTADKLSQFRDTQPFTSLPGEEKAALERLAVGLRLTVQQIRQLVIIARDLQMWQAGSLAAWAEEVEGLDSLKGKQAASRLTSAITSRWEQERRRGAVYRGTPPERTSPAQQLVNRTAPATILGACPVASPKTRCCNLMTLDAAINCGFGCSYCTIQSFYDEGRIFLHTDLGERLRDLELDPDETYHIGTGQSSDSLMWGNKENLLEDLFDFARTHPNVILELKTKSANIAYLLDNPPPRNVLVTWTLNSREMISWEEHGTAGLDERLRAAARIAENGNLVGFHFHPMVPHEGWQTAYGDIFARLTSEFAPEQVALVSFGTLTFIKPVIRAIRERGEKTQVLRMPLKETAGKFSYPAETKEELFRFAFESLSSWHGKVFFYLCMEPAELWEPVFGFSFPDNESFEAAMKQAYLEKISTEK